MVARLLDRRNFLLLVVAGLLALGLFIIDTFTPLEGAVAVLYVIPLLLAAQIRVAWPIVSVAGFGLLLASVSFTLAHFNGPTASEIVRLAVALIIVCLTAFLLVRDCISRAQLIAANQSLARSEWRYRSIFERSPISLWEQDFSGAVAIMERLRGKGVTDLADYNSRNPGFLRSLTDTIVNTGINDAMVEVLGASSREEAFAASMAEFRPNDSTMLAILQAIYDGREEYHGQGVLYGLDGRERVVLVAKAFPSDIATTGRVVGTLVDVTEREKTREMIAGARRELARATRAATVGALSASIAHELNQPLSAVVMNAQTCVRWLKKTPPDVAAASAAADRAVAAGMRASDIVRETRELLSRRTSRSETVDVGELVHEVIGLLDREIEEHRATVSLHIPGELPTVTADRGSLQQVLVNLTTNALHAMSENDASRRILVLSAAGPKEGQISILIRDHGPGISEENLGRLFEPFFTTKEGGMGMGLAISRMAMEANGGSLVASNHEEGGAIFECLLPLEEAA